MHFYEMKKMKNFIITDFSLSLSLLPWFAFHLQKIKISNIEIRVNSYY